MATGEVFIAADLGASSGRLVGGRLDGGRLELDELYRFANGGISIGSGLYWDLLGQWVHIQNGLRAAAERYGGTATSIGVDTWGVDFGLLGRGDELLGNPRHYRDQRTTGIFERAFEIVPREEIFDATGLQFMPFNTLYQLLAMRLEDSPLLSAAECLLMMPDLFHWLMTGEKAVEATNASTTQMLDPRSGQWAVDMLARFDIPTSILPNTAAPGTTLGTLRQDVQRATGLDSVPVVVPGTHDTASAVMAVPAAASGGDRPNWCYISSGTWSLMGIEVAQPIISARCAALNFTNEGGVGNTVRLLKNIAGLWLVQECRRIWQQEGTDLDWPALVQLAGESPALRSVVDPDHSSLVAPDNMPSAIVERCRATGEPVPESRGAIIRCALESLALRYRAVLGWLEELNGAPIETIHIVGGGTQNELLCQMAADACNRTVIAGPIEATAIGNVMVQAVAHGAVNSIAEAREVVRGSFPVREYVPRRSAAWDAAFERFQSVVGEGA